jgi:hypothetical protein
MIFVSELKTVMLYRRDKRGVQPCGFVRPEFKFEKIKIIFHQMSKLRDFACHGNMSKIIFLVRIGKSEKGKRQMTLINRTIPIWFWCIAILGLGWNFYGVFQYLGTFSNTAQKLMAQGMTQAQADIYLSLPPWISVVFAIGVFGAVAGCILLLLRKKQAKGVFYISLVGYTLLFLGDVYCGVFANIPTQLAILTFVLIVAAALLWFSHFTERKNILT